jgi:hypothetical protein
VILAEVSAQLVPRRAVRKKRKKGIVQYFYSAANKLDLCNIWRMRQARFRRLQHINSHILLDNRCVLQ